MSSSTTSSSPSRAPAPEHQSPSGLARIVALDRLRGLALVAMVVHHMTEWLTGDARAVLPGWSSFAVTDVAAPAFFVAAGASASLFMAARRRRGMTRPRVAAQVLRRYGLLIPVGLAFDWLLWRHPAMFGVIEALGVTVVIGAGLAVAVGARWLPALAAATLAAGVLAERAVTGNAGWWADEVVAGKFPAVTYVGFVLVGMAAVRTGRFADRRWGLTVATLGAAAVALLLAVGVPPDRYPGGPAFVVPGLAGTALVYALAQCGWPTWLGAAGRLIQSAAAHTLGIFLAHYVIYYVLVDRTGLAGTVPGAIALPAALLTAVVLAAVAPRVPQLPWSPRTGRRRRPPAEPAAGGAAVTLPTR
ncbi:MAG TPA: acyltransferase family protein [Acidimicrobiales bacterium]